MVKKSQRRNGGAKVSTKSQAKKRSRLRRFGFTAKLAHKTPIEGWDDRKSLKANYANLGIAYDANSVVARPNTAYSNPTEQAQPSRAGILTERLNYLQNLPKPEPYEVRSMSVQEQYRLQNLIREHGTNYTAMERDLKHNTMQETANKLQKRIELMFRIQSLQNGDILHEASQVLADKAKKDTGDDSDDDEEEEELPDEDEEDISPQELEEYIKSIQTPDRIVIPGLMKPVLPPRRGRRQAVNTKKRSNDDDSD